MVLPTHENAEELPKRENSRPKGVIAGLKLQGYCTTLVRSRANCLNQLVPTCIKAYRLVLSSPLPPGSGYYGRHKKRAGGRNHLRVTWENF